MRPELLSVRAVNQYRRRDILAYIGLRYYLESKSAQTDKWAREVSTHLVNTRDEPIYFRSYHYKELGEGDSVVYRNIYIPGPNEILAESTLLQECSLSPSFSTLPCVYSYKFPAKNNKEGVFRSYFLVLRNVIFLLPKPVQTQTEQWFDILIFVNSIQTFRKNWLWSTGD